VCIGDEGGAGDDEFVSAVVVGGVAGVIAPPEAMKLCLFSD
jgi:hypothetical protein